MVKSIAILGMAGAAAAYGGQVPVYPTPVPPVTPITPVPTPVYSSTMTIRTTYYPSQTDIPGAIHTNKVTSTYHFNPSTYRPDPSDACHGGVIIFNVKGELTTPLKVGFTLAKASAIAGTNPNDYHVYEAVYNLATATSAITSLVCDKHAFEKTVASFAGAPAEWDVGVEGTCNTVVYPEGKTAEVCTSCTPGYFLYNNKCIQCTPLPVNYTPCAANEILTCSSPSNSVCTAV